MILIMIKAILIAIALWVLYEVGRCSAVHEICDYKHGRVSELSHDIISCFTEYDKE